MSYVKPSAGIYRTNIGGYSGGSAVLDGQIDNVQIWNRVLSASEVMQLYLYPFKSVTTNKTNNICSSQNKLFAHNGQTQRRRPSLQRYAG